MALSQQQILDGIAEMSVLELSELISAIEEKFGVTAAAPVAAVQAPAGGGDESAAEVQTEFSITLTGFGDKKVGVIKVVRAITGLGLKEAKDLVEAVPSAVKEGIKKEEAEDFKKQIEEAGGSAEIK